MHLRTGQARLAVRLRSSIARDTLWLGAVSVCACPTGRCAGPDPPAARSRSRALCEVGDRRAVRRIRLLTVDELVARELLSDRGPERTGAATVDDADALEACQRGCVDERTHGLARLLCPQPAYVELVRHVARRAREEMHARLGRR